MITYLLLRAIWRSLFGRRYYAAPPRSRGCGSGYGSYPRGRSYFYVRPRGTPPPRTGRSPLGGMRGPGGFGGPGRMSGGSGFGSSHHGGFGGGMSRGGGAGRGRR